MNDNPFNAWTNQLLDYQRQYQEALQGFTPRATPAGFGSAAPSSNPWVAALEQWWKTVQPGTQPPVNDFYTRLVDQGKVYFQMTQSMNNAFQQASAAGESAARWQEAVNKTLGGLKDMFGGHRPDVQGVARQAIAFWELPLNTWQRAVSSSSILPGDFLQDVSAQGVRQVRDELHDRVDQLLSTPAIGQMREQQEQAQTLAKLTLDYQQALHDYTATYGEIGVKSVEALQRLLEQRQADNEPVASLREMYDLWVDSCEEAYAEYVSTDKYSAVYGHLVNSLMALKRHGTMMVDESLGAMNMPTRSEIDTLQQRLQEVRREGKALRAEIESLKYDLIKSRPASDGAEAGQASENVSKNPVPKAAAKAKTKKSASAAKSTPNKSTSKKKRRSTANGRDNDLRS
ncbi:MAG: class III poly(R)-hydroxyalkanoic acid synthase subunit PhaE [Gammaproteobacteria bacterium]